MYVACQPSWLVHEAVHSPMCISSVKVKCYAITNQTLVPKLYNDCFPTTKEH